MTARARPHRYEELASFITGLVDSGTLWPGSRAPSLRQISRQRRTSLSTALQAYRLLEDRGVLEARPQSGFYVARRAAISLETPAMSQPPANATSVAISGDGAEAAGICRRSRGSCRWAARSRAPSCWRPGRLDRFLARAARVKGAEYNVYTVAEGRSAAAPGDRPARAALGAGAVARGCRDHLRLHRGADAGAESRGAARRHHRDRVADLFRPAARRSRRSVSRRSSCRPMPATGIDLAALEQAVERQIGRGVPVRVELQQSAGLHHARREEDRNCCDLLAKHQRAADRGRHLRRHLFRRRAAKAVHGALDRRGNTIYCSSFSKTIAPGYRIGWIATGRHMQTVLEHKIGARRCAARRCPRPRSPTSCRPAATTAICAGSGGCSPTISTR